jgi:hypothetical protein
MPGRARRNRRSRAQSEIRYPTGHPVIASPLEPAIAEAIPPQDYFDTLHNVELDTPAYGIAVARDVVPIGPDSRLAMHLTPEQNQAVQSRVYPHYPYDGGLFPEEDMARYLRNQLGNSVSRDPYWGPTRREALNNYNDYLIATLYPSPGTQATKGAYEYGMDENRNLSLRQLPLQNAAAAEDR